MINLKRDSKCELKKTEGMRTRASSIYKPGQPSSFKISRSKFSDYLTCERCFYLDRVKGLASPGMPGWSLNVAVDDLLKKEFDYYRTKNVKCFLSCNNSEWFQNDMKRFLENKLKQNRSRPLSKVAELTPMHEANSVM